MANKRKTGCLLAVGGAMLLGMAVVCGGLYGVAQAPGWLVEELVEDSPRPQDFPASDVARDQVVGRVSHDLSSTGTLRITGPELTRVMQDTWPDHFHGGAVIEGDHLFLSGAGRLEDAEVQGWVHFTVGARFLYEDGGFVHAEFSDLSVGDWDLALFFQADSPEQHAAQINRELVKSRLRDPEMAKKLDKVQRLTVEDGALVLTVTENGRDLIKPPRGYRPDPPDPASD